MVFGLISSATELISNHISVLNWIVNNAVKLYTLFKYNITLSVSSELCGNWEWETVDVAYLRQ